jgi:hypothetical protein
MLIGASYPIELWGEIFRDFRQVEKVRVNTSAERLDITIKKRQVILQATREELDDTLYKFSGNPKEVASYFLKKHNVLIYYQETLVGYFDIMGYSSFIEGNTVEQAIQRVSNFLNEAISFAKTDILAVKIDHWILSDSIIIVVDTNRNSLFEGSLELFLGICSMVMRYGMQHGFPLRGAIGGGEFYKDGEVMVSSALVDAARYEKEQEWLGAVLTPKALVMVEKAKEFDIRQKGSSLIDFSSDRFKHYVRFGIIPWKKNENRNIRNIDKPDETYFIKPFDMAKVDWVSKYLPDHFDKLNKSKMIENSHYLYAQK